MDDLEDEIEYYDRAGDSDYPANTPGRDAYAQGLTNVEPALMLEPRAESHTVRQGKK